LPFIYIYYPETAKRSLEEIDLIFAKGFLENMSYVKAAKELPYLDEQGVEDMQRQYGFFDDNDAALDMGAKRESYTAEETTVAP
jgi:hypothetical protein